MKTIQPIVIWSLGQVKQGNLLNAYVVADNLKDAATFYFCIQADSETLSQGNLVMTGADYEGYVSNEYAFDWVAGKLGVTITGDYVPAVAEPSAAAAE